MEDILRLIPAHARNLTRGRSNAPARIDVSLLEQAANSNSGVVQSFRLFQPPEFLLTTFRSERTSLHSLHPQRVGLWD